MKRTNIGFLIVLFILIVFSYFYVTIYSKYDVMLYLNDYKEIIQLNRIIEVLLLITIAFFVYKIFFRSNYVFGSRITKKLFILLSSVIVIPSLINIKINRSYDDVIKFTVSQRKIVLNLWNCLEDNGYLLYITCSIFRDENQDNIAWFKDNIKGFKLIDELQIIPTEYNDSLYYALVKKNK